MCFTIGEYTEVWYQDSKVTVPALLSALNNLK